jgi:hypothetical protein
VFIIQLVCFKWSEENIVEIRKRMKERNLVKEVGCSWIEAENRFIYHGGETSHPKAEKICKELDKLVRRIIKMGYVSNTTQCG